MSSVSPATHIFVLIISSELRDKQPYAVPVQFFPYAGLKEVDMRRIITQLVKEMVRNGMKVAGKCILEHVHVYTMFIYVCSFLYMFTSVLFPGFVTNGEFNYMRSKGYTRPLSVLQIRADIRNKYNRIKQETLLNMLTPEGKVM